jgi:hypothetical protein
MEVIAVILVTLIVLMVVLEVGQRRDERWFYGDDEDD